MQNKKVKLLLGLHSHQPVGNFDFVFEDAYKKSYFPFMNIAKDYPDFKFTVHFTGALWEFFEERHPEFIDMIGEMLSKDQIEIVISGFYEPVLASIPEVDRRHQIKKSISYIKKKYGIRPHGLWLTERVFESDVLKTLVDLGLSYVVVDDYHFLQSGILQKNLFGYYLTEHEGKKIGVFPINQTLRYLVPFKKPSEIMAYLKEIKDNMPQGAACIFDDGEKFGIWPGTFEWVYEKGWLREFIETVLKSDFVETDTYSGYMKKTKPLGRVYLPSSSYFEMGEWSLPADVGVRFMEFVDHLKKQNLFEANRMFVKGGIWKNFLVKYSEANAMHKKMIFVSKLVNAYKGSRKKEALSHLLKGQANDAYWHGVFGGLYLPHLRRAIYEHLLKAESIVAKDLFVKDDLNADGYEEVYMKNKNISLGITSKDGSIYELSLPKRGINFQDTLTRRFEHYHKDVEVIKEHKEDAHTKSIHEIKRYVKEEVKKEMVYDWYERRSFIVHILPPGTHVDMMRYMNFKELGDFVNMPYNIRADKAKPAVYLHRKGGIYPEGGHYPFEVGKRVILDKDAVYMSLNTNKNVPISALVGIEFNLHFVKPTFIVGNNTYKGNEKMFEDTGDNLVIEDEFFNVKMKFCTSWKGSIWVYPVYTLSQSESGMDMVYQGSSILFVYPISIKSFNINILMEV